MLQRALTDLFPARRTLGTAVLDPGFDVALDRARDLLGATSASLSDAPDVDFANLLARNDHAIVGLASALCRASPESALAVARSGRLSGGLQSPCGLHSVGSRYFFASLQGLQAGTTLPRVERPPRTSGTR